ncbi:hypothetical protein, partial [Phormidesmis sp. 146-33]
WWTAVALALVMTIAIGFPSEAMAGTDIRSLPQNKLLTSSISTAPGATLIQTAGGGIVCAPETSYTIGDWVNVAGGFRIQKQNLWIQTLPGYTMTDFDGYFQLISAPYSLNNYENPTRLEYSVEPRLRNTSAFPNTPRDKGGIAFIKFRTNLRTQRFTYRFSNGFVYSAQTGKTPIADKFNQREFEFNCNA